MDCQRDIWGGRRQQDRVTYKNNPINKHFNSVSYNLSGNLVLAGGNSPYVCLYDLNFQILLKKFKLTSNRSLDGILHILNSGANKADLDNYDYENESNDSDYEKTNKSVVTINKSVKEKKSFNVPIKITKVLFSYSNRSFYIASSEGIYVFSLDNTNSTLGGAMSIDENVSPQKAVIAYLDENYVQAITYATILQSSDLLTKFINNIDLKNAEIIVSKLSLSCLVSLCDFFMKKIESDSLIQLNLKWILSIFKTRYRELKSIKDKKVFVGFNKLISKYYNGLIGVMDENSYTIDYILDQM